MEDAASGLRGGRVPHEQVTEIQRSRLLAAAVDVFDERGYADTSVSRITRRARVSRRTFYELFANREECLAAVLDHVLALVERDLHDAGQNGVPWRERMRGGLWVILTFFEREPALARICVVQAARSGGVLLERRDEILRQLVAAVDEGRSESPSAACTPLTAEGVVGAALAIIYVRLARRESEPLTGLLSELCAMIVLPYLGAAAARREQARPAPVVPAAAADHPHEFSRGVRDPLRDVSMRLTYRTARVLEGVGEHPGSSNREVGDYAGIGDAGQVSKLLARLQRLGVIENQGAGTHAKGEPNAWSLTLKGEGIRQSIHMHAADGGHAA